MKRLQHQNKKKIDSFFSLAIIVVVGFVGLYCCCVPQHNILCGVCVYDVFAYSARMYSMWPLATCFKHPHLPCGELVRIYENHRQLIHACVLVVCDYNALLSKFNRLYAMLNLIS